MQSPSVHIKHSYRLKQVETNSASNPVTRNVSESDSPEIFTDIYQDRHNIVIWRRNLVTSLLEDVKGLLASNDFLQISCQVTPQNSITEVQEALCSFKCADSLSEDISELVDMFCSLFGLEQAGLRLTALDRAMCPRFHVDKVPCRLVTTYLGSSTQWLPHDAVDRSKLGRGNNGLPDELSGIYRHHDDIQQLTQGDVALLKGTNWEANEQSALVHRSPTPKSGEARLLMTLDFI